MVNQTTLYTNIKETSALTTESETKTLLHPHSGQTQRRLAHAIVSVLTASHPYHALRKWASPSLLP